ncbi:MAG: MarR family transcriptional regulator [Candidatus Leucobacter sulfamidivorax]|nr:MarR family transcriptional regulator [Candidatus Leucobacter sulfamidivorax]
MSDVKMSVEGGSQTLSRGLVALAMIGESRSPLTVADLAEGLGIHRSMANRLVRTFEQHGFAARTSSGHLVLGPRLVALARGVSRDLQATAAPELAAVADELDMTAFLVVYDGEAAVTLSNAEPRLASTTVAQRPGSRHSIDKGAPGRVIRSQLHPDLHPPRRFEHSRDEVLPGVSSIAVPLRLPQGEPAAIAVLYLPRPLDQEHVAEVLIAAAKRIGAALR